MSADGIDDNLAEAEPAGNSRHDQGSIAASRRPRPNASRPPRRDGELEVLQPRQPSPAQNAHRLHLSHR